jgi:hypothetical protein
MATMTPRSSTALAMLGFSLLLLLTTLSQFPAHSARPCRGRPHRPHLARRFGPHPIADDAADAATSTSLGLASNAISAAHLQAFLPDSWLPAAAGTPPAAGTSWLMHAAVTEVEAAGGVPDDATFFPRTPGPASGVAPATSAAAGSSDGWSVVVPSVRHEVGKEGGVLGVAFALSRR